MSAIVLVHGAWLGGWCWDRLRPHIEHPSRPVYTPTLTGLGDKAQSSGSSVNLDTQIADITALITNEGLRDVTLIGHSFAGMVITGVAARLPNVLAELVYLDALLPARGESVISGFSPGGQAAVKAEAQAWGDGSCWPVPQDIAEMSVITDFSAEDLAWFHARATPHPLAAFTQPLHDTPDADVPYKRTYIVCTRDRPTLPAFLSTLQADPGWRVMTLDTGHWPMITAPAALAGLLQIA